MCKYSSHFASTKPSCWAAATRWRLLLCAAKSLQQICSKQRQKLELNQHHWSFLIVVITNIWNNLMSHHCKRAVCWEQAFLCWIMLWLVNYELGHLSRAHPSANTCETLGRLWNKSYSPFLLLVLQAPSSLIWINNLRQIDVSKTGPVKRVFF